MGLLLYLVQFPLLEFQRLPQHSCKLRGGFLKDVVFLDQCTRSLYPPEVLGINGLQIVDLESPEVLFLIG